MEQNFFLANILKKYSCTAAVINQHKSGTVDLFEPTLATNAQPKIKCSLCSAFVHLSFYEEHFALCASFRPSDCFFFQKFCDYSPTIEKVLSSFLAGFSIDALDLLDKYYKDLAKTSNNKTDICGKKFCGEHIDWKIKLLIRKY